MDNNKNMTRREALRRMGVAVAGAAMASSGLLSLTSCGEKRTKRIILYFTGTGNCLHVARELAAAANGETELLSIPQLMKHGRFELEADEIGIVYPIYGHMPPYMVRQFIKKARLNAAYKFAVLTYGNRKCSAVEIWDGISRRAGKAFDYICTLIMVDNWLPNFDMNVEGDCEFCFACIQNCPQKAIRFAPNPDDPLLANGEKNPNARYRNEHISLMDIKRANSQK